MTIQRAVFVFIAIWTTIVLFPRCPAVANEMPASLAEPGDSGAVAPIPEEWRKAFSAIEPDPHPEKLTRDSHYWITDEQRHDLFRESIADSGGIFIGLGPDQNYLMAAWAKPEVLIPLDFDQAIVDLHYVFRVIFLNAPDAKAFIDMWQEENTAETRALLKEAYAEKSPSFRKGVLRAFKVGSRFVRRRLKRIVKKFGRLEVPTFLSDPKQYQFIVDMFRANRVFPVRGDLTATKTLRQLAEAAKKVGLPVRTLYLSNAEQYFKYTSDYRQNMFALPFDDRTKVIRTVGTKKPWTADGVYDYVCQTGDNFRAWLAHKKTFNVWTIVQARKVDKKTGFSRVTRVPED
jgi:hypothetical protein